MSEVIKHDFGKSEREMARTLNRLLKLVADQDEDMLKNPGKYFKLASDRIIKLEMFIEQLVDAARPPIAVSFNLIEMNRDALGINVPAHRYKAMLAIEALLRNRP